MDTDGGAARLRLSRNLPTAGRGSVGAMAYDEALAERIRDRLRDTDGQGAAFVATLPPK
jgi:hypothetical protein